MSDISSDFLFHFTNNKEFLIEALKDSAFSPRYSYEDLGHIHQKLSTVAGIYILMKCFCDIPLNKLMRKHIEKYGKFGIGLEKDWGIRNNLCPIHYIPKNHDTWYTNNLKKLYAKIDNELCELIVNYFIYTKPVEARKDNFYDEREWRYIPSIEKIRSLTGEDLRIKYHYRFPTVEPLMNDKMIEENDKIKKHPTLKLRFSINDIKYIITNQKSEHDEMKEILIQNGNRDFKHIEFKTVEDVLEVSP